MLSGERSGKYVQQGLEIRGLKQCKHHRLSGTKCGGTDPDRGLIKIQTTVLNWVGKQFAFIIMEKSRKKKRKSQSESIAGISNWFIIIREKFSKYEQQVLEIHGLKECILGCERVAFIITEKKSRKKKRKS